jgi:antitoxin component HigA of HigAB toxin-antitoxin module
MDIRPIKTKTDYEAALKEIESLFDSKPEVTRLTALIFLRLWSRSTKTGIFLSRPRDSGD